jgi:hypothetical protein
MTKETTEKVTSVENMTKEKMAQIIKSARKKAKPSERKNTLSTGDGMKTSTSEIIKKIESQIPTYTQLYSALYAKYLHAVDDFYSTSNVSEKEFFDKLGMDSTALQAFDEYWKSITDMVLHQIDLATNFAKKYVQFRLSAIDSYGKVARIMMDNYAKAWAGFNSSNKTSSSKITV